MAKRHPSLVEVSREHHDGLLLALRLQQGEQALPRLWSHDTVWQVQHVTEFHAKHLTHHFAVEEEQIFPVAEQKIADAGPIVARLRDDHRFFTSAVAAFAGREHEVTRDELSNFGKRLEEHIRLEDRTLFPMMEKHLPGSILDHLEEKVGKYYP